MSSPMKVKEYPWRVKKLAEKLEGMNGDPLTAEESRALIKLVSETQLDLWDMVIQLTADVDASVKHMQKCLDDVKKYAVGLLLTVVSGVILWLATSVLPDVIAHIQEAANVVQ